MRKPNVIFILADDMGYGDFAAFNGGITHTPALDNLVEEGVVLTRCYSSSPVCAPARASILTGRYPQRTGVVDTLESRGLDRLGLQEITMAQIFQQNGYHTGLVGKWHLGAIGRAYHPNNRGFDYFLGFRGGWSDYYSYNIEQNGTPLACNGQYLTDMISQDCVKYINSHKDQPFFLHVNYNAPHYPHQAPPELFEKYKKTGKYNSAVSAVYAMIERMDHGIGEILDTVKELGLEEDTIVIFTSDNGPEMEGTGDSNTIRFNCDLRGKKALVYEGGILVPTVVKYKHCLPAGTQCHETVHHTDWLPTLMRLCSLSYSDLPTMDGMDVLDGLNGKPMPSRTLCWQWNRYYPVLEGNAAILSDGWKLVHPPIYENISLPRWEIAIDEDIKQNPGQYTEIVDLPMRLTIPGDVQSELFHLTSDPQESSNLIQREDIRAKALEEKLRAWFESVEKDRKQSVTNS